MYCDLTYLNKYIHAYEKHYKLSKEDIYENITRYQAGDVSAGQKIVMGHLRWALKLIAYYVNRYKQSYGDLLPYAIMNIYKAMDKFDVKRGTSFTTYSRFWIIQALNRRLIRNNVVNIPEYIMNEDEEKPKICTIDDHGMIKQSQNKYLIDPAAVYKDTLMKANIHKVINKIGDRERTMIEMKFGLKDGVQHTLDEIGEVFHLSRERVRQLIDIELRKLLKNKEMRKIYKEAG